MVISMINRQNYKVLGTLCFILLMINYKFFYLFRLPGTYAQRTNEIPYTIASVVIFVVIIVIYNLNNYKFNFLNFIILFYFFLLVEVFFTLFRYSDEPISNSLKVIVPFFSLVSYFIYSIFSQDNLKLFLKMIIIVSSIVGVISIIELYLYMKFGLSIFHVYGFNYGLTDDQASSINYLRNGRFRLIVNDLVEFSSVISIGCLFGKQFKNKIFLIVNIFITVVYTFIVAQIRSVTLFIILIFALIYLLTKKIDKPMIYTFIFICFALALCLLYFFRNEVSMLINAQYSYYHRIDEIVFYFKRFVISPIFGNGLILGEKSLYNSQVVTGFDYIAPFSYSDVGIVGMVGEFGILGLTIGAYLLIKIVRLYRSTRNTIILAIAIMTLFSFINLSLLDAERLPILAIYMAVIDGICANCPEKGKS